MQQQIEINLPADLPLVRADATLAEQAIGNVVTNAVLHTPQQTQVQLDADIAPSEIALRVSDNGPGIPADELPHVFEKFVKGADSSLSHADGSQGTGLGLPLVASIVREHGGNLHVQSGPGEGTTVEVELPVGEDEVGVTSGTRVAEALGRARA